MFYDQWPFFLFATATFSFEKVAWVRAVQNSYNYGDLPLGLVAMATES